MSNFRRQATINSALWAAYADALGFITELANSKATVKSRSGQETILETIPWKRKLEGIYGTQVELPKGTYSDDTQLRLSTSRAINGRGYFDVEAFAKCELPVWLSYALGAGRGTKIATNNLIKKSINWYSNFYSQKDSKYIQGGGNGAAMRIQPHVWAATNLHDIESYIVDVIKNSIVTHGHPRGILGAIFHSLSLARVLRNEKLSLESLKEDAFICSRASVFIKQDDMLETFWVHQWEAETKLSLDDAFANGAEELLTDIESVSTWVESTDTNYTQLTNIMGLTNPEQRGSGTKTALAASLLLLKSYTSTNAHKLLVDVVNELKSDTDTIGTMFGALYGAQANALPPGHIQDYDYIVSEANRMYRLSVGEDTETFEYPDALNWIPNRSSLDNSMVATNNKVHIDLFGELTPISVSYEDRKNEYLFKWYLTKHGFSILLKRRVFKELLEEEPQCAPNTISSVDNPSIHNSDSYDTAQISATASTQSKTVALTPMVYDMKALAREAIESNFDETLIGQHIKLLAKKKNYSIESVIAYSSIIANAFNNDPTT
ncbi:ADP-ribosylglycohydrolase family protein [Vibrio diazotrophicus]|uniref:ADP-ribosylglycohydrolase family protein n=1 Tax=Vibrio diazotrophicus TaxID=685 RepID=UPI0005AA9BB5|nr:ADP-ribosylglycohydrolase family protein [Vibrio diazotrophicus]